MSFRELTESAFEIQVFDSTIERGDFLVLKVVGEALFDHDDGWVPLQEEYRWQVLQNYGNELDVKLVGQTNGMFTAKKTGMEGIAIIRDGRFSVSFGATRRRLHIGPGRASAMAPNAAIWRLGKCEQDYERVDNRLYHIPGIHYLANRGL